MQRIIQEYFNINGQTAATILISLTVFISGFILNGLVKALAAFSNRRGNRKIFSTALNSLNDSIPRVEIALEETLASIRIDSNELWEINQPTFYQVSIFREMGYKDIFKAYFTGIENSFYFMCKANRNKKRREALNTLYKNISQLEAWSTTDFLNFSQIFVKYNQFGDARNEAVEKLRIYWEDLTVKLNRQDVLHNQYLDRFFLILKYYKSIPTNERVNPYTTHRKLVLPIRILNKKYAKYIDLRTFTDLALQASHHYVDMERYIRAIKIQIQEFRSHLSEIKSANNYILEIL